jgi:hypothetical protein
LTSAHVQITLPFSDAEEDEMSRRSGLSTAVLGALAGLATAAPSASAAPPPAASCLGVLSTFAAETRTRDDFAPPVSGASVARIAGEHGDLPYCITVFFGP